jgi:CheY-specific phosphatase CheX
MPLISPQLQQELLDPFIAAVQVTLQEMAKTEVSVRALWRGPVSQPPGEVAAVLELTSPIEGPLILWFPSATASALAGRIFAEVHVNPAEELIRDCLGEIANVVCGQAKAMLSGTRYAFRFSTPTVLSSAKIPAKEGKDWVVITFATDAGDLALQLGLTSERLKDEG